MNSNGPERRRSEMDLDQIKKDISEMRTDIALLINKLDLDHKSLRQSITRNESLIEKHEKTLYGNGVEGLTSKVNGFRDEMFSLAKRIDEHTIADRWAYGIFITIQSSIFVKLFWPH